MYGGNPIFSQCILNLKDSKVVIVSGQYNDSNINNDLDIINQASPELAEIIKEGLLKYPQLHSELINLCKELSAAKKAVGYDRQSRLKKVAEILKNIATIVTSWNELAPYAGSLINTLNNMCKSVFGVEIPVPDFLSRMF